MIPFIDLQTQYRHVGAEIEEAVLRVLRSGQYILGPEVEKLEVALAKYVGVRHAIGCASGTDALQIALMAKGVGRDDAVLTTPFTFAATAGVIALVGATPVFIDIDPVTFNMDPDALERTLAALVSGNQTKPGRPQAGALRPCGVIAVDLFGLPANYDRINTIAAHHDLFVIEDAAQSFGASRYGRRAGGLAEIACTSFFPAKPLGCAGDGGAIFTDDAGFDSVCRSIRVHGQGSDRYDNLRLGLTGRLDALQAALLMPKLGIFPDELAARQQVAANYADALRAADAGVVAPTVPDNHVSAWAQYCLLAQDGEHRRRLLDGLKAAGIPTAIYYPKPLHLQQAFAGLGYGRGDFPVSEDVAGRIFAVPMHPYLDRATIDRIAGVIAEQAS